MLVGGASRAMHYTWTLNSPQDINLQSQVSRQTGDSFTISRGDIQAGVQSLKFTLTVRSIPYTTFLAAHKVCMESRPSALFFVIYEIVTVKSACGGGTGD